MLEFVSCLPYKDSYTVGDVEPDFNRELRVFSQEGGDVEGSDMIWNPGRLVFPFNAGNEVVSECTEVRTVKEVVFNCLSCLATGTNWGWMRRQLHLKGVFCKEAVATSETVVFNLCLAIQLGPWGHAWM